MAKLTVALFKRGKYEVNLPEGIAESLYNNFVKKCIEVDLECRDLTPEVYNIPSRKIELDESSVEPAKELILEGSAEEDDFTFDTPVSYFSRDTLKEESEEPKEEIPVLKDREEIGVVHNIEGFSGFLKIECEKCGKIHSFCAKEKQRDFYCKECGHITHITRLRHMFLNCPCCGRHSRYFTNFTEEDVTENCFFCKEPVDLFLLRKKGTYVTSKKHKSLLDEVEVD